MLSDEQIAEVTAEMVPKGTPVRFQIGGQTINIMTGEKQAKGINVMYQIFYWNFTKETSSKIAQWVGAVPVFSEG
ncbi:uncharacterized protein NMK_2064 [Novimethylophilus kurashikiensis]|uniref:Uncharacterized protein n=1 Tax=Novimethylophilus kurashikiensis TaxID=1825523 RepID=A0A2R5F8V3_9PROT|nr:hypothetical protein [Novimethylophilus kurashikiensis]GBG14465.1 uncharacterized protein NMK_2064 [Novimethylophilus kurashikiensis]